MTKERFDIHQHITDKIVSAIERGAGDFRLPWHRSAGNIMRPVNIASKKAYRGVNVVALWTARRTSRGARKNFRIDGGALGALGG
jgi:antirestriction protein ArdC